MHEWIKLTTRMGKCVPSPTVADLKQALADVFSSEDDEHPDCWIECGSEFKPLHVLSFLSNGRGSYVKYADMDMREELEVRDIVVDNVEEALRTWELLINEHYEQL